MKAKLFILAAATILVVASLLLTTTSTRAFADVGISKTRLVAIGDIHGDLDQYKTILQLSELVNNEGDWVGGTTTLVQVGDLLDRGPDDVAVLKFSEELASEAKEAGGKVINLIGNHEIMNLQGAFHYVHPKSMEETGTKAERKQRFSAEGDLGKYLRNSFQLLHAEMGTVFVHAGLPAQYAKYGLDELNTIAKDAMDNDSWDSPIFASSGPVWTRTLINEASVGKCGRLEAALQELEGVERMVVGHTPQRSGALETYCDDRLIAVDVGMSKHMYGHLAALELTQDPNSGEVEMREISARFANEAEQEAKEKELEKSKATNLNEALNDQHILQEIYETVQEVQKRAEKKDDGSDL